MAVRACDARHGNNSERRKGEGSSSHYVIQQYRMAPTVRRAAGRAACWQVADEHTGPGTGRAGTDGASGQREMLASLVKNVVGLKVTRAKVSVSSSHSITAERGG